MEKYLTALWIYLAVVNIALFILMGVDKVKAIKGSRRIPEATLFLLALLGGGLGGSVGMFSFRHKTRHLKFLIGFPVITIVQAGRFIWLVQSI